MQISIGFWLRLFLSPWRIYHQHGIAITPSAISIIGIGIGIAFLILVDSVSTANEQSRPNILVILADDMGYGDLTLHGSRDVQTPNLDALAKSGVQCTRAYVTSSVCSPSRAGIMTGRDPRRFGYQANLNRANSSYPTDAKYLGLPVGEHTLADQLKQAGYATGLFGKWHLGTTASFHPNRRGFDYFFGMLKGSHNYFPKPENSRLERNGKPIKEFGGRYLTDIFTEEALAWIEEKQKKENPWFAFLSYNAPHTPMQAKAEDLARQSGLRRPKRKTYSAMMRSLDENVGRIHQRLLELNELENTLIVFFSDNGGATNNASWNGFLSGSKGCLREGGIRVPMFFSWPKTLPNAVIDVPVSSLDLLPTFLAAANTKPLPLNEPASYEDRKNRRRIVRQKGAYDGIDLMPLLQHNKTIPSRALYFRLQGQAAIIVDNYKLIRLSHRPAQLFDVATDPGESTDLARSHPEKLFRLFKTLGDWESKLPTAPLWQSSPFWDGESSRNFDSIGVRREADVAK